jgi:hypothetical protein
MYLMYVSASNNTPAYTHINLYVVWRVHPLGIMSWRNVMAMGRVMAICTSLLPPHSHPAPNKDNEHLGRLIAMYNYILIVCCNMCSSSYIATQVEKIQWFSMPFEKHAWFGALSKLLQLIETLNEQHPHARNAPLFKSWWLVPSLQFISKHCSFKWKKM